MFPVIIPTTAHVVANSPLFIENMRRDNKLTFKTKINEGDDDYGSNVITSAITNGVFIPLRNGTIHFSKNHGADKEVCFYQEDTDSYAPFFNDDGITLTPIDTRKVFESSLMGGFIRVPPLDFTNYMINHVLSKLDVPVLLGNVTINPIYFNKKLGYTTVFSTNAILYVNKSWVMIKDNKVFHINSSPISIKGDKIHELEVKELIEPSKWKLGKEIDLDIYGGSVDTLKEKAQIAIVLPWYNHHPYASDQINNKSALSSVSRFTATTPTNVSIHIKTPYDVTEPEYGKYVLDLLNLEYDVFTKTEFNSGVVDASKLEGVHDFALLHTGALVYDIKGLEEFAKANVEKQRIDYTVDTIRRLEMTVIKLTDEKTLSNKAIALLRKDWFFNNLFTDLFRLTLKKDDENPKPRYFRGGWNMIEKEHIKDFHDFINRFIIYKTITIPVATPRFKGNENLTNKLAASQRTGVSFSFTSDGLRIQNNHLVENKCDYDDFTF